MTKTVLHIDSSITLTGSKSREASAALVKSENASHVVTRDVARDFPKHLTAEWAVARLVPQDARTPAQVEALAYSDALIAELVAADTIIIGAPMYNFAVPIGLKAWIDMIARPKVTFEYTAEGPRGLLSGKKVIVAMASGGVPIGSPVDHATPYLKTVLGFIGITDVTFVNAADLIAV